MAQLNIHITPTFEHDLRKFMKIRHLKNKAEAIRTAINHHARELRMSTVNLTETLIRLQNRQPQLFNEMEEKLLYSEIRFIPPDIQ